MVNLACHKIGNLVIWNYLLQYSSNNFDIKKIGCIFRFEEIHVRCPLFSVAEIVRVSREKKKGCQWSEQVGAAEDATLATHSSTDRIGDLLLPFRSRDPLIQNLRKLHRSKRRSDRTILGVVSWALLQFNCSWRLEETFIFVKSRANAAFSAFLYRGSEQIDDHVPLYTHTCEVIRKKSEKKIDEWFRLDGAWLPWEHTCT